MARGGLRQALLGVHGCGKQAVRVAAPGQQITDVMGECLCQSSFPSFRGRHGLADSDTIAAMHEMDNWVVAWYRSIVWSLAGVA